MIAWALAGAGRPRSLYEVDRARAGVAASCGRFAWRAGLLRGVRVRLVGVPVLLQARYGEEFLSFTEQPGTIWGTSSMSESLRLLGFWVIYVGVGFGATEPFLALPSHLPLQRPR